MTDLTTAQPGDRLPPVAFGRITRQILALYAGASGDHNPVHVDLDFARKAGLDDVFAHGMLSMGVLARVVTGWAGQDRVVSVSNRFMAITPVGANLTCSGEVAERLDIGGVPHLRVALAADVTLDDGRTARTLAGEALVRAD
ncbi:Acyl dehydratase [Gemmobacter megaterium]|uniref:Acyl dehydratase n=1 Tax=Gemmobacter megaterium TaxID=1086013 RepID=A0A1N7MZT1_9RHOB|nr:MaoC/PaaZ C-terminal domain-containing protein [Gemmobacter megaterium]GGE12093.1 MaoC family dehydratase [Gemmobacter megaterium]SIS91600.1 Acyl dehydratase [Gemmobacter megaterium]